MRPLETVPATAVNALAGLVFDLDGTVLSDGQLTLAAYQALHQLHDAGLSLVACTGRPASWGALIARQWPVALCVTENGAIAYRREGVGLRTLDRHGAAERAARARELERIVATLRERFPELEPTDDNDGRITDFTFDIGERQRVPADQIAAVREAAQELGARTFVSSIHLHVTLEPDDKASGTLWALASLGEEPTGALRRYAFVGDSANDAACFAAFRLTFAVANVAPHLGALHVPPRYLSRESQGAGFAAIAARILELRAS